MWYNFKWRHKFYVDIRNQVFVNYQTKAYNQPIQEFGNAQHENTIHKVVDERVRRNPNSPFGRMVKSKEINISGLNL